MIPWGGGGLTCGIASALKALRPEVRVVTVRAGDRRAAAASLGHESPQEIEYTPSWVDGAGGRSLVPAMWERARELVDEAVSVSLEETAPTRCACSPPAPTSSRKEPAHSRSRPP